MTHFLPQSDCTGIVLPNVAAADGGATPGWPLGVSASPEGSSHPERERFGTPHSNLSFQFLQHLKGCPSGTSWPWLRTISTLLRSQWRLSE